jgi:hypothetical protein
MKGDQRMLTLNIPGIEQWDESKQEFVYTEGVTLELEHSLVSLSKWESIWEKPFLSPDPKTTEETLSYIEAMTLTRDFPKDVFQRLSAEDYQRINAYIESKMTATWITEKKDAPGASKRREIITAEIIYFWMSSHDIAKEFETWHLNRLITLIKVANEKSKPPEKNKKLTKNDLASRQAENARRQAMLNNQG